MSRGIKITLSLVICTILYVTLMIDENKHPLVNQLEDWGFIERRIRDLSEVPLPEKGCILAHTERTKYWGVRYIALTEKEDFPPTGDSFYYNKAALVCEDAIAARVRAVTLSRSYSEDTPTVSRIFTDDHFKFHSEKDSIKIWTAMPKGQDWSIWDYNYFIRACLSLNNLTPAGRDSSLGYCPIGFTPVIVRGITRKHQKFEDGCTFWAQSKLPGMWLSIVAMPMDSGCPQYLNEETLREVHKVFRLLLFVGDHDGK